MNFFHCLNLKPDEFKFILRAAGKKCTTRRPFNLLRVFDNKFLYIINQR